MTRPIYPRHFCSLRVNSRVLEGAPSSFFEGGLLQSNASNSLLFVSRATTIPSYAPGFPGNADLPIGSWVSPSSFFLPGVLASRPELRRVMPALLGLKLQPPPFPIPGVSGIPVYPVRAGSWAIFVGTAFRGGPPSQFLASKTKPSITPMNLSAFQHHHSPIHNSLSVPSHPSSPSHPQPPFIEAPLP